MGRFWVTAPMQAQPTPQFVIWRQKFQADIQNALITSTNPMGTITINDLELLAMITGAMLAAQHSTASHPSILSAADNTSAISWARKGSTTSTSAPAFLLHHLGHLRRASPFAFCPVFTPGASNLVADCCSRSFDWSDNQLLRHINTACPVQPSWMLVTPPKELLYNLNSSLFG
jgi:hypothetical protein